MPAPSNFEKFKQDFIKHMTRFGIEVSPQFFNNYLAYKGLLELLKSKIKEGENVPLGKLKFMGIVADEAYVGYVLTASIMSAIMSGWDVQHDISGLVDEPEDTKDLDDPARWSSIQGVVGFYTVKFENKTSTEFTNARAICIVSKSASPQIVAVGKERRCFDSSTTATTKMYFHSKKEDSNQVTKVDAEGSGFMEGLSTSVFVNPDTNSYHLNLSSYFTTPCHTRTYINDELASDMKALPREFFGIENISGALPKKGMTINGQTTATTAKGTATVAWNFIFLLG